MPRLVYVAGWALLVLAGAFLLTDHLLAPPPGVTERNVRRVKAGVTPAEVQALMGHYPQSTWEWRPGFRVEWWEGPTGGVRVRYDGEGRVSTAEFMARQ